MSVGADNLADGDFIMLPLLASIPPPAKDRRSRGKRTVDHLVKRSPVVNKSLAKKREKKVS